MKSSRASGPSAARMNRKPGFRPDIPRYKNDMHIDDYDFNQITDKRVHVEFFNNFKDDFDLEDWK